MKIIITQASCRQLVECRHFARTAECAWLPEADVVEQNDDDVRRPLRGVNFKARRCLGIARVQLRGSWPRRLGNWEHSSINFLRRQWQRPQARRSDQLMRPSGLLVY